MVITLTETQEMEEGLGGVHTAQGTLNMASAFNFHTLPHRIRLNIYLVPSWWHVFYFGGWGGENVWRMCVVKKATRGIVLKASPDPGPFLSPLN